MTAPILSAHGLVKRYGRVTALDHADFELLPGEILAVIGDNGAGKSTLIKSLSGAVTPDHGEIRLGGELVHFRSPMDARAAGIETVYQHLALSPALSIADNLFLGRELRRCWRAIRIRIFQFAIMYNIAEARLQRPVLRELPAPFETKTAKARLACGVDRCHHIRLRRGSPIQKIRRVEVHLEFDVGAIFLVGVLAIDDADIVLHHANMNAADVRMRCRRQCHRRAKSRQARCCSPHRISPQGAQT